MQQAQGPQNSQNTNDWDNGTDTVFSTHKELQKAVKHIRGNRISSKT